jgi:3-hydroxyacyl-CoA dehydrogenase
MSPSIANATDLIVSAAQLPIEEGLALERNAFLKLRTSTEAQALRNTPFALCALELAKVYLSF